MVRGYCSSVWNIIVVGIYYYCCHWSTTKPTAFAWGFSVDTFSRWRPKFVERQKLLPVGALGSSHHPKKDSATDFLDQEQVSNLENLLSECGWDDRLVTLSAATLPVLAEFQQDGAIQIGTILRLEFQNETTHSEKLPSLIVEMAPSIAAANTTDSSRTKNNDTATVKIDLGQLTTIWSTTTHHRQPSPPSIQDLSTAQTSFQNLISLSQVDQLLEDVYETARRRSEALSSSFSKKQHHGQGRGGGGGGRASWTKKELEQWIDRIPTSVSLAKKNQIEMVLRQMTKAGPGHEKLVDSQVIARSLPSITSTSTSTSNTLDLDESHKIVPPPLIQQALAAYILDQSGGGRFKRMSCLPVSSDNVLGSVTVVNGGWLAVDTTVRAASEARALARTGTSRGTNADERIVHRLEYLALSTTSSTNGQSRDTNITKEDLQVDVREYLKAMELPYSPEGANEALIQMGIWSLESTNPDRIIKPQPWSPEILQAVKWYQLMDGKRKARLAKNLLQAKTASQPTISLEGRFDLTRLPCVCVDAPRTAFRDDAIGVRPRASTGRKVFNSSRWEILIHTADVSDLYAPTVVERSEQLQLLQAAAAKRGSSRYDLPTGPLHFLPPSLLKTLSILATHPDITEKPSKYLTDSFNRCVTLWVYIDTTTGKLLDSGLERTLISRPLGLTFQSATDLLQDGETSQRNMYPIMDKAKLLLRLVERELTLWSDHRRETDTSAKARDDRLKLREQVDRHVYGDSSEKGVGQGGFRRSRGHQLIEMCSEVHGYALADLLKGAKASFPYVAGTERDGRIAAAPLRRFIDGVSQRQALAVLCGYGGKPLSNSECVKVGQEATKTINAISNIQTFKGKSTPTTNRTSSSKLKKQKQAARALLHKLSQTRIGEEQGFLAMSTGKQSEVVVLGFGAVARCKGIEGTLKPGEEVLVAIQHVDPLTGHIKAALLKDGRVVKKNDAP